MNALIFDVKRFAIHDGPGIRTTVFFKGCPLSCPWCHNPEGISRDKEIITYDDRCIRCGDCVGACPEGVLSMRNGGLRVERDRCTMCGECESVCPAEAIEVIGKEVGLEELLSELEADRMFYEESGGGVTFSGGEPLMQCAFLLKALEECKKRGMDTAVDTSGFSDRDCILEVARYTDLFLYDLKHMESAVHERFTGVPNERIIENLELLSHSGAEIIVRIPVVKGFNDGLEHAWKAADFLSNLEGIIGVEILKYHGAWAGKFARLGKSYEPYLSGEPSEETLGEIRDVFAKRGFEVR